jgi:hypothetical protein
MVDRLQPDLSTKNIRQAGDSFRRLQQEIRGWDVVLHEDDFLGDALDARYPAAVSAVDGSFDKIAGGLGGTATIDVGDGANSADNEAGGIGLGGLEWKGDNNCFTIARIKISAITTVKVEFGFVDSFGDAGAADVLATPSATADDAAVWVFDTDDTATWQTFAVNGGATPTKNEAATIVAPVAATYQYMGVFLEGDNAIFRQWDTSGNRVGDDLIHAAGIEGGTAVGPKLFVQNRANTIDRLVTIDYIMTGQRRS